MQMSFRRKGALSDARKDSTKEAFFHSLGEREGLAEKEVPSSILVRPNLRNFGACLLD
jgi:hypothetical protein